MKHINEEQTIAKFFVYRSFENNFDITVQGVNGTFHTPEVLAEFIVTPYENDLKPIENAIISKYPEFDHDVFYNVYTTLDYDSGEYGDYGECHCPPYYTVGEVLVIEIEEIDFDMEDTDSTESPSHGVTEAEAFGNDCRTGQC